MIQRIPVGCDKRNPGSRFLTLHSGTYRHREIVGQFKLIFHRRLLFVGYQVIVATLEGKKHIVGICEHIMLSELVNVVTVIDYDGVDREFA